MAAINKVLHNNLLNLHVIVWLHTEAWQRGNNTECYYNANTFTMHNAGLDNPMVSGEPSTIGQQRHEWGDEWVASSLPDNMPCVVYEFPSHGVTAVAVKQQHLMDELARLAKVMA